MLQINEETEEAFFLRWA